MGVQVSPEGARTQNTSISKGKGLFQLLFGLLAGCTSRARPVTFNGSAAQLESPRRRPLPPAHRLPAAANAWHSSCRGRGAAATHSHASRNIVVWKRNENYSANLL